MPWRTSVVPDVVNVEQTQPDDSAHEHGWMHANACRHATSQLRKKMYPYIMNMHGSNALCEP